MELNRTITDNTKFPFASTKLSFFQHMKMASSTSGLDDEIAAVSRQIEDIDHLNQRSRHPLNRPRHPLDRPTGLEEARAAYRAELVQQLSVLRDRKHAQGIAQPLLPGAPAIAPIMNRDQRRRRYQNLARQMNDLTLSRESAAENEVSTLIIFLSPRHLFGLQVLLGTCTNPEQRCQCLSTDKRLESNP